MALPSGPITEALAAGPLMATPGATAPTNPTLPITEARAAEMARRTIT